MHKKTPPQQLDLFDDASPEVALPPAFEPGNTPADASQCRLDADGLMLVEDDDLVSSLPGASCRDTVLLCAEIGRRKLVAALPALMDVWRRFIGFGRERPMPEQAAVIRCLGRIGGSGAQSALRVMMTDAAPGIHGEVLLAVANLQADGGARTDLAGAPGTMAPILPSGLVRSFLQHPEPSLRLAACSIALSNGVDREDVRERLTDRDPIVSRLAAVALAEVGDETVRAQLNVHIFTHPDSRMIRALGNVAGDDEIVFLGRLGATRPEWRDVVMAVLQDHVEQGHERAGVLAAGLQNMPR